MNITIRSLTRTDQEAWKPLWQAYLTFYESAVPDAVSEATFNRLTDPAQSERAAFVAVLDDKIIGFVHYITHAHNWRLEDVIYLQDLYVAPSARGKGAARALINRVYSAADENGTPSVYWMTQESNVTARNLYDQVATLTPFVKYQRPS
ncbi:MULTISPECIES: GNAT family N-acetyltransferase [Pacificibacter]|uniref:GNAT family N-acetyltransferase n=1 Tax=Pacificibacter TaxID=1042323 RepID=UPI001C0924B1|nr:MULTISPECIES: GNAT family N-acetyltransferase [Pacificibacter]MBU2936262.1 GNAT family N-acetyltransferase [Pacificibacter marinus]MDO6616731.1 GNAT family N-acetyltransferase [Pacificibacter sp. 1_MG-2023]